MRILDAIDLILVAYLLYEFYRLMRGTSTINIFFGIISIYLLYKLVNYLDMALLSEILGAFISVGVIALIVVFQPEIRKFLLMLGTPGYIRKNSRRFLFWRITYSSVPELDTQAVLQACEDMAATFTGSLIVIERGNELGQFAESGTRLDASLSPTLIASIFFHNAPLHDGAMIIARNRIQAAGCILPVSANPHLPPHLGLRHRAAIGITEQSDALAIVVSEETGKISLAEHGQLKEDLSMEELTAMLQEQFPGQENKH
ncbi:MAG TPA: diadenylate cyclase CdaA [Bacteroidales bacterium]|nr:diadenylate cyclase CdaA [Bacteroidales bacterium]HRZ76360.1 diadenylate cyclase CdaA [Bacteroidales bacterium]